MSTTTTDTTFGGRTADEWRAMAADCRKRSAESWDRSDTDGCLTQWAADTMAQRYERCAVAAEQGGVMWTAIYDLEGNHIPHRVVETRYGQRYVWEDADGTTVWFSESNAANEDTRRRNNARKGVYVGTALYAGYLERGGDALPLLRDGFLKALDNGHN